MLGFKPKNEKTQGQFSTVWKLLARAKKEVSVKEECDTQWQVISQAIAQLVTRSRSQTASYKMIAMDCPVCSTPQRSKRALLKYIKDDHPGTKFPASSVENSTTVSTDLTSMKGVRMQQTTISVPSADMFLITSCK